MSEPIWIRDEIVLAIHNRQLSEHGGGEGVRDFSLLDSALNKPKNLYHYGDPKPSLAAMTTAYAYGICKNHPFVDGNKRTAFVICLLFLKLNGAELTVSQAEKYEAFLNLAAGNISESELSDWIAQSLAK
ncbi:MAG: type II toxin-antitoxin system death-on-curing family toxin [Robiginitomaculum sp.]|nr:MAG: type II toxin-antitoxin system death-on-curing family toxin [Robiginitomaculum sp.]